MGNVNDNEITATFTKRLFVPEQNEKGSGDFREVYEVDKVRHKVLWDILLASNNPHVKGRFNDNPQDVNALKTWERRIATLNRKLIELEIIIPDRKPNGESNEI